MEVGMTIVATALAAGFFVGFGWCMWINPDSAMSQAQAYILRVVTGIICLICSVAAYLLMKPEWKTMIVIVAIILLMLLMGRLVGTAASIGFRGLRRHDVSSDPTNKRDAH